MTTSFHHTIILINNKETKLRKIRNILTPFTVKMILVKIIIMSFNSHLKRKEKEKVVKIKTMIDIETKTRYFQIEHNMNQLKCSILMGIQRIIVQTIVRIQINNLSHPVQLNRTRIQFHLIHLQTGSKKIYMCNRK